MTWAAVYLRVGCAEAWLGDLEVDDLAPETVSAALPPFLRDVAANTSGIALEHERD